LDDVVILRDNIYTERAEGREEGRMEERKRNVQSLKAIGVDEAVIAQALGLTIDFLS
jgi:predicted transposase YdaD